MISEGTIQVLASVMKKDHIFTAAEIFSDTGMDRQLVYYHLGVFVKKGFLEKVDQKYIVVNKDGLVEALAYGKRNTKKVKAVPTKIYTEHNAGVLNDAIQYCLEARALKVDGARELKQRLNEELEKTINSLQDAKRGMNTRQLKEKKAHTLVMDSQAWGERYIRILEHFRIEVESEVVRQQYENIINDE